MPYYRSKTGKFFTLKFKKVEFKINVTPTFYEFPNLHCLFPYLVEIVNDVNSIITTIVDAKNNKKLKYFHEIYNSGSWSGKRCFLVGGGPSLKNFDFSLLNGEKVIAINKSFIDLPNADIMFAIDKKFYDWVTNEEFSNEDTLRGVKEKFNNFKGIKLWLKLPGEAYPDDIYLINSLGDKGVSDKLEDGIYFGANSGYGALNLAMCLGANPIYLLGYDMSQSENGETHYHGGYPTKQSTKALDTFISRFPRIARIVKEKNIEIINLNPDSNLRCFKFEEFPNKKMENPLIIENNSGLKILIVTQHFRELLGSVMYVYELSKELVKRGNKVTILSNIGGDITERARSFGIKCVDFKYIDSLNNNFDIMHLNQPNSSKIALAKFHNIPAISTIHSQWNWEEAIISPQIKKYIYIRNNILPSILDKGISIYKTIFIPNGIDTERFNTNDVVNPERKKVFFAGTLDNVRKPTIMKIIRDSKQENFDVEIMGKNCHFSSTEMEYLKRYANVLDDSWDIDKNTKNCSETASIMLGRTTIEGWFCGKPGWIYDIDLKGNINNYSLYPVPKNLSDYDIKNVAAEIEKLYTEIVNENKNSIINLNSSEKITAITATGDRTIAFELSKKWMSQQTVKPTQWIIVDDGKIPMQNIPKNATYVRRDPQNSDPEHTLILNLKEAFPLVNGDKIIMWEDDEYYAPKYIETMLKHLDNYEVVGIIHSKYYHLSSGKYFLNPNIKHSSLAQTVFKSSFLSKIYPILKGDPYLDMRIWKIAENGYLFDDGEDDPLYVGMKGLPGRIGVGCGHKNGNWYKEDHEHNILKKWIPKDYVDYMKLINKNNTPKISIVMPTYNQDKYIKEAIDSILNQTFKDFELIIVNDGSTDDTENIIKTYNDKRIIYLEKENGGTGSALNLGFSIARGKYETWFASDNVLYLNGLEELNKYLDESNNIDYVYANFDVVQMDKDGLNEISRYNIKEVLNQEWNINTIFEDYYNMGIFWLWRKELKVKTGSNYILEPCEDYEMICRMIFAGGKFAFFDKCLGFYRKHDLNLSQKIQNNNCDYTKNIIEKMRKKRDELFKSDDISEKLFTDVFINNKFGGKASRSGRGSDEDQTKIIKNEIIKLVEEYNIETIVDVPCGDFKWMQEIIPKININKYIGIDIVQELIDKNIKEYANNKISFRCKNILKKILTIKSDLIICRDFLVHLTFDEIYIALKNIMKSESEYILLTTFTRERENKDHPPGKLIWRPLDLTKPPFNFSNPIKLINEGCTEKSINEVFDDKSLGLWKIEELKKFMI